VLKRDLGKQAPAAVATVASDLAMLARIERITARRGVC
jgi:hypothetical protein